MRAVFYTLYHMRRLGSFSEQFALLFRDYLRAHPQVADEYARLKIDLARRYNRPEDREAYTNAKGPFIWQVMYQANTWMQETGWSSGPTDE